MPDETLKKIAHELAENLWKSITVDWSARESVRATLRLMVKRILRKYKHPPDQQEQAVELVLQQADALVMLGGCSYVPVEMITRFVSSTILRIMPFQ